MYHIDLMPPVVDGRRVRFRWSVEPRSALYHATECSLVFPAGIDLSRVPDRLWWDLLLMCLHSHWLLLRPCRVRLPLKLSADERQFWIRMLQTGADTLAAYHEPPDVSGDLGIEILGGMLHVPRTPVHGSGFATAFSGGKDSLLQTALLCELTPDPLLVATTSPLPPLSDHLTARRRHVFDAIQTRRRIRFVEVDSDFRSTWHNGFADSRGYRIAVNELTDTFLYTASLAAAAAAVGATHLFVASEAEVQASAVLNGRIVQHKHFMYSAATQRALDRLLRRSGLHLSSMTWPLYSVQVQRLLWARYPDLSDLQYSCWRVGPDQATCSACEQCFRIAMTALAERGDPGRIGIDLRSVLRYAPAWEARYDRPRTTSMGPAEREGRAVDRRVMEMIGRVPVSHVVGLLAGRRPATLLAPDIWSSLARFGRLQRRARRQPPEPAIGVREAFLGWLDPEIRDQLTQIYATHFPVEPRSRHAAEYERSRLLGDRMRAPLN
jgi:hypothetical protein